MIDTLRRRIIALEKQLKPIDPWTVTVLFRDGHRENMTAKRFYEAVKEDVTGVCAIDQRITGNLDEFDSWIAAIKFEAEYRVDNNDFEDIGG